MIDFFLGGGAGLQQGFLFLKTICLETSLVTQWLRLQDPNAGGLGSIPGLETRNHMPNQESACCN